VLYRDASPNEDLTVATRHSSGTRRSEDEPSPGFKKCNRDLATMVGMDRCIVQVGRLRWCAVAVAGTSDERDVTTAKLKELATDARAAASALCPATRRLHSVWTSD
jgi:hypothetical protein